MWPAAQLILDRIAEDWPDADDESSAGRAIVKYVFATARKREIQLQTLIQVASEEGVKDKEAVARIIIYLCGSRARLFKIKYAIVDDDSAPFPLEDPEDQIAAIKHSIDPRTGEYQDDLKSKIYSYFSPVVSISE